MICIWSSWCHCQPIISCSSKIWTGLPFWCRLTQVVLEKRPLNGCGVVVAVWTWSCVSWLFLTVVRTQLMWTCVGVWLEHATVCAGEAPVVAAEQNASVGCVSPRCGENLYSTVQAGQCSLLASYTFILNYLHKARRLWDAWSSSFFLSVRQQGFETFWIDFHDIWGRGFPWYNEKLIEFLVVWAPKSALLRLLSVVDLMIRVEATEDILVINMSSI